MCLNDKFLFVEEDKQIMCYVDVLKIVVINVYVNI